jgi:tetratricopeptide (TPR) repeat protein
VSHDGGRVDSEAVTREHHPDPAAEEHLRQAQRYMERHDHEASVDAAISILEGLIRSEGDAARFEAALARACLFKHELTKQRMWEMRAATAAARASDLDPDSPATLLALGDVHRVAGRFVEAEREYGLALAAQPDLYEAMLGRARTLDALDRHVDAIQSFESCIAKRPADWRGYNFLGRIHFDHGDYARALIPWMRVTELVPDNARAASNLGSTLYRLDRLEEALGAFRHSLEIQPNAMAYTNLGTTLFFLERYAEAAEAFEKSVAMTPAMPTAWGNLGNALSHVPGRAERSREALRRAAGLAREQLERNPSDAELWARLAEWLVNLEDHANARASVEEALRRGPENAVCLTCAARVQLQWNDRDGALDLLQRAIRAGCAPETLRRGLEFRVLSGDPRFQELLRGGPRSSEMRSEPEVEGGS